MKDGDQGTLQRGLRGDRLRQGDADSGADDRHQGEGRDVEDDQPSFDPLNFEKGTFLNPLNLSLIQHLGRWPG